MKLLRNIDFWRMLKILCIILCAVFLFAACSNDEGASTGPGADKKGSIETQRSCYMENNKLVCPETDDQAAVHDCIQASLIKMFYEGLGSMASAVYTKTTSEDLFSLMFLAFSIWMAFQILRHVSATTPESMGEFWTKVLRKATLCVACGILASSPENIYYTVNTFILPVYVTLLEFASAVLELLSNSEEAKSSELKIENPDQEFLNELGKDEFVEKYNHTMADAGCKITNSQSIQMTDGKFPSGPSDMMGCMACAISDRLNVGYTLAMLLMKSGNIFAFLVAIFILVAFTIAKWGFALYLVDSIFRLTMMIVVMPFLILFFPFEQTRKWTITGFKIILNSAGILLCVAVLLGMTVYAMQSLFNNDSIGDFGSKETYKNFNTISLSMMFMGFVIIKATGMAVSLSDKVTGGGGNARFQKKVQQMVGNLAKLLWAAITAGASKTFDGLKKAISVANPAVAKGMEAGKQMGQKATQAANKLAQTDKLQDQMNGDAKI